MQFTAIEFIRFTMYFEIAMIHLGLGNAGLNFCTTKKISSYINCWFGASFLFNAINNNLMLHKIV